jgi:hypothetical protein
LNIKLYIYRHLALSVYDNLIEFYSLSISPDENDRDLLGDMGREMHALSCTSKAICTWNTQKAMSRSMWWSWIFIWYVKKKKRIKI